MKIAIHQPNYLPYLGFFAKLFLSDVFVIYDTTQFTRGDFINRNRIRSFFPNSYHWLTVPMGKKNYAGVAINQMKIDKTEVFQDHKKTLQYMYSKAPFFDEEVCECVGTHHKSLVEHNCFLIRFFIDKLGIKSPKMILSSELALSKKHGSEALLEIVNVLGGDEYISGNGGKAYLNLDLFKNGSVKLSFSDLEPVMYPQIHPGFVENMSIVDAVFNIGWEKTKTIIENSKIKPWTEKL